MGVTLGVWGPPRGKRKGHQPQGGGGGQGNIGCVDLHMGWEVRAAPRDPIPWIDGMWGSSAPQRGCGGPDPTDWHHLGGSPTPKTDMGVSTPQTDIIWGSQPQR